MTRKTERVWFMVCLGLIYACGDAEAEPDAAQTSEPAVLAPEPDTTCAPDGRAYLSCRFASGFNPNNCLDLPMDEGWDEDGAREYCLAQENIEADTLEITDDASCFEEHGGGPESKRCAVEDEGRRGYIYLTTAPLVIAANVVCGVNVPGTLEVQLFCDSSDRSSSPSP